MRVVAGSAGGIPLVTPRTGLRPTMDRVKEAMFSSVGEAVVGARVLDLFAGTGALGIEALSRGAQAATFVEKDPVAIEALQQNLVKTHLAGTVHRLDVFRFLDRLVPVSAADLIFADPPYQKKPDERDFSAELLHCAGLARSLAPGGLFILEHQPGHRVQPQAPWEIIRSRRYGSTELIYLTCSAL